MHVWRQSSPRSKTYSNSAPGRRSSAPIVPRVSRRGDHRSARTVLEHETRPDSSSTLIESQPSLATPAPLPPTSRASRLRRSDARASRVRSRCMRPSRLESRTSRARTSPRGNGESPRRHRAGSSSPAWYRSIASATSSTRPASSASWYVATSAPATRRPSFEPPLRPSPLPRERNAPTKDRFRRTSADAGCRQPRKRRHLPRLSQRLSHEAVDDLDSAQPCASTAHHKRLPKPRALVRFRPGALAMHNCRRTYQGERLERA